MKIYFFLVAFVSLLLGACTPEPVGTSFITVSPDGQFMRYGKPYYYVGANFGTVPSSDQKVKAVIVNACTRNWIS